MSHINYIVSAVLFFLFIYITFIKYGDKSEIHKTIFSKCEDTYILEAFNKIDLSGKEYMQKHILNNNSRFKIIMKKDKGIAASVRLNKVYLNDGFNDPLFLESFRDILHESRHIMDEKLLKVQFVLSLFTGISLSILCILLLLSRFFNFNENITIFRFILDLFGIIIFSISSTISITLENNAIRHVVISCNGKLNELCFEKEIIDKVYNHLSLQATYISEWYTMQLVSGFLFILSLFLCSI